LMMLKYLVERATSKQREKYIVVVERKPSLV